MKRTLTQQRRLAASIHENPPQYNADTNQVDVSFKVEVGPVVTVRTVGARLTVIPFLAGRQRKQLIPIYSEGAIDQDLVEEGQRNLADYFQKKGFYDVKVTTNFQKQPDQILVVYTIDRGKKHKVDRILFHGNNELSTKELMELVTVKKSHIWTHGSVSQKLLKQSADNIQALYRDRGYEEVKVTPRTVDREPKIDSLSTSWRAIRPWSRMSRSRGIRTSPRTAHRAQRIPPPRWIPFSPRKLAEDRNRISATYLNRGYLNAEVKTTVKSNPGDPHRVNIAYAITEHQIGENRGSRLYGAETNAALADEKTAQVPPETPMRRGQLLEAESRLYDLGSLTGPAWVRESPSPTRRTKWLW